MSNDLNDLIIEIGGWDYLKKQEELLIEQGKQDWEKIQADEEEELLNEIRF